MSNIREIINTVYLSDKYHILDSLTAGSLTIALTQFLEGTIKFVGWGLTILLFLRTIYGLYKDKLDVKKQKLDIEIKNLELKNKLKPKEDAKVIEMDSTI